MNVININKECDFATRALLSHISWLVGKVQCYNSLLWFAETSKH